jgi:hypothetical protein
MMSKPTYGPHFVVRYPFINDIYETVKDDGPVKVHSWRPGVRFEPVGPEDNEAVADGEGNMILTVVASFKPGHFPERVFFTRRFVSPDGQEFGNHKLHIVTAEKFRRMVKGYQFSYLLAEAGAA